MITLQSDTLRFQFSAIDDALRGMVENHVQNTLPRLLGEDRHRLVEQLRLEWPFCEAGDVLRKAAEDRLLGATAEQIEAALRMKCREAADLSPSSNFAGASVSFQRTLRIPDDGKIYPLPASLGCFPLRHVDDFQDTVPETWLTRGGVMMPMYQSEALWLHFGGRYPTALKIGAGKIDAVTGLPWSGGLNSRPQDYVVLPTQPWLDGFAVRKGVIRQFVAMPLGDGYSVEEQLTGKAEHGGIQLQAFPMKAEVYFTKVMARSLPTGLRDIVSLLVGPEIYWLQERLYSPLRYSARGTSVSEAMGLGAGGTMRQEIYKDSYGLSAWDTTVSSRCFVHLCNSLVWRQITGNHPPHPPLTAKEYARNRMPWFDYYRDDLIPLKGSKILARVKSVLQVGAGKGAAPLPENASIVPETIVQYGNTRRPDEVREWADH